MHTEARGRAVYDSGKLDFSLPRDEVARRHARRAQIVEDVARLTQEMQAIDQWLAAVAVIFPHVDQSESKDLITDSSNDDGETRSEWRRIIDSVLTSAQTGLMPRNIAQRIREGSDDVAKQRYRQNPNGIYNALKRMLDDESVVKSGEKYFSKELYQKLLDDGTLQEDTADQSLTGMPGFIMRTLEHGKKYLPSDVMAIIDADPVHGQHMKRTPGIGYAALSRLVKRGKLLRDGQHYVLPQKNEPFGGEAPNGSDAGSVFD